jgi:hypothetical protein
MQMEVRDKDSTLVYGPRALSYQDQKSQVLWWNGKDNGGQVVDMERGPFVTVLDLQYGESGKGRAEQHVRRAIKGLFPNLIFVEKIEPIPSQIIELRNYPIGPIYTAHWDQNQNQIIVDPIKPFGDYIEIYEAGKKKLAFSLTLSINSRVPPWQMGAELAGKYSLKIDKYGDIMGQFNGTGFTLLFKKDINNIPSIEDFGKQKVILTMEYNYKWPDGTYLPVATEVIVETLWVFFQVDDKNISQDPPHFGFASYWHSSTQPNWFEYWRQVEFMEQPPFESNKARYIPELRLDQYGAYYIQEPKYYIYANCAYHGYAMEEGVIVVDTTGRRKPPEHLLAELYDFKAMVFLCYHENFHRTKFV